MYKYIQDTIENNSRSITAWMTKPQKKSFAEMMRGVFVENTPILRQLVIAPIVTFGAGGGTRTRMVLLPQDFKSCVATNYTTPAL